MKKDSLLFKASLLSISTILTAGPVAAALIPLMAATFSNRSLSSVELIATIPNFGILLFVMLSNIFVKYLGQKKTVLLGLIIALVTGLVPVVTSNYTIILISRFLFGAGVGLFNALAVSLITDLYDGEEQAAMMGLQSAVGGVCSTILTFSLAFLMQFGWNTSFIVYGVTVIPLLLFGMFVTLPSAEAIDRGVEEQVVEKGSINVNTILLMFFALFVFAFFFIIMLKTGTLLVETGIGTPENAASILGSVTIVGIFVGVLYGPIFKFLQGYVLPIGLLGMALGIFIMSLASSTMIVSVGAIIAGISFSLASPYMFMMIGEIVPKASINLATSLLLVGINLGVFLAPTINATLVKIFNIMDAKGNLRMSSIAIVILSALSFVAVTKIMKDKKGA